MMRGYARRDGGELLAGVQPEELLALVRDPHAVVWVDMESPEPDELAVLQDAFAINHLTVEDIAKHGQRAKIESYDHYVYIVMHRVDTKAERGSIATPEVDLILGPNYLVSVHDGAAEDLLAGHHLPQLTDEAMARGPDFLLYTLADNLVDSYFPVLDAIADEMDALEDDIVAHLQDTILARIFKTKRDLVQLRKVISPQIEVFARLTSRAYPQIQEPHAIYFRDVHDHLIRASEVIDSYRDLISGSLEAYLSTVNNRLSEVMKRLTLIATIFMPLTFITGIFGQNFGFMPQVQQDPGYSFWLVMALMALITSVQVWYYRRKGWL